MRRNGVQEIYTNDKDFEKNRMGRTSLPIRTNEAKRSLSYSKSLQKKV